MYQQCNMLIGVSTVTTRITDSPVKNIYCLYNVKEIFEKAWIYVTKEYFKKLQTEKSERSDKPAWQIVYRKVDV